MCSDYYFCKVQLSCGAGYDKCSCGLYGFWIQCLRKGPCHRVYLNERRLLNQLTITRK